VLCADGKIANSCTRAQPADAADAPGQPARRGHDYKRSDRDDETWFLRVGDGRLIARVSPSGVRLD
jgi:hypothetical protein